MLSACLGGGKSLEKYELNSAEERGDDSNLLIVLMLR